MTFSLIQSVRRCDELTKVLIANNFPAMSVHSGLNQTERIERYNKFKEGKARILVSTDVFARGVDIERVNIVVNYDMPENSDTYLHRVGRAGRFGTKGLAVSFVSTEEDSKILEGVQSRFEVEITEMPARVDSSTYSMNIHYFLISFFSDCLNLVAKIFLNLLIKIKFYI